MAAQIFDELFSDSSPIRTSGDFTIASCRDQSNTQRVVISTTPEHQPALIEMARVHRLLDHPQIPKVVETGLSEDDIAYVVFDCDAITDLDTVWKELAAGDERVDWSIGMGGWVAWLDTLEPAHNTTDPTTGGPICLGVVSWSNVLVSRDGRGHLIGFGHNVNTNARPGYGQELSALFHAPEVALGAAPSPAGDVWAMILLIRTLLPITILPAGLERVMSGQPLPEDKQVADAYWEMNESVFSPRPERRPQTIGEIRALYDRLLEFAGQTASYEQFRAFLEENVGRLLKRRDRTLTLAKDNSWFSIGSYPATNIARRGSMKAILIALIDQLTGAQRSLPADELIEVGWPDQRLVHESALNRLYVAVAALRSAGLKDFLVTDEEGYRLVASVKVRKV